MNGIKKTQNYSQGRIVFILVGFLLLAFLILSRLFYWQVIRSNNLQALAQGQYRETSSIPAQRGSILSSDGFPLVTSREAWLVWASLPDLELSAAEAADELAPILAPNERDVEALDSAEPRKEIIEEERTRLYALLTKEARWVPLRHKITREQKEQIEKLEIAGIGFDPQEQRSYPEGTMAAHLLGFVGKDTAGQDQGYFGLEGYYDMTLSGISGELSRERDALGLPLLIGSSIRVRPLDGMSLKTHIDRTIQFFVEEELKKGVERYGATRGSAILMRPGDGAILAMASVPAYNPARFTEYQENQFINPAVGETFEPGSIFKVLVVAAALDAGAVEPDSRCDKCAGPRKIAEYEIGTWNKEYHPDTTVRDIIKNSDNVGMIWVAEQLGMERLVSYLEKFGVGRLTGIDLQDETTPSLRPQNKWRFIDLAVASFGQGIAITPIQMLRAVAVIANGGVLPVPQVVDAIQGEDWAQDIKPNFEGRVISEKTAQEIKEMMVYAVEEGEARWAKPKDFKIAGKTGTAQIPVAGHYDEDKTIASFVGFAPADNPKFVMLVSLHEPTSSPWGSETAAPLWFSIAKQLFPYLGIHPEN